MTSNVVVPKIELWRVRPVISDDDLRDGDTVREERPATAISLRSQLPEAVCTRFRVILNHGETQEEWEFAPLGEQDEIGTRKGPT